MSNRALSLGGLFGMIVAASASTASLAHSGGTDSNGCHGGSQPYHCHSGAGSSRSAPTVNFGTECLPELSRCLRT